MLVAALLAVLAIRYLVDQVIVGVVLNLFVLGITNFLFTDFVTQNADKYNSPNQYLHIYQVPVLGDIPVIGAVFFDGTVFLYLAYAAVLRCSFGLFHTRWGLRLRAVGEHPRAADTVGIKVLWTRYQAMLIAGVIAGLAGAFLVVGEGQGGTFSESMSSGKGYIALAAVIFGRWTPRGAVLAALLFGFADQLQNLLGAGEPADQPEPAAAWLPYIATLFAVAGFVGRVRAPGRRRPALHGRVMPRHRLGGAAGGRATEAMAPRLRAVLEVPGRRGGPGRRRPDRGRLQRGERLVRARRCAPSAGWCPRCTPRGGGRLVAFACVDGAGALLMPCGRCRQLLWEHGGAGPAGRHRRRAQVPMTEVLPRGLRPGATWC